MEGESPHNNFWCLCRYYLHSRRKMADIYLVHKNDRRSYTRTYQELAESAQTAESFLVLGEAFMSIQEVNTQPGFLPLMHLE